jgi:ribulose-phosphate 3-epimerase
MKYELAPSILSADMGNMRSVVGEFLDAGCERIHLDVMDGQFVPPITFGAQFAQSIFDDRGFFEAHLMTESPEKHFDAFAKAGCKGIMFHVEATDHPHRLLQQLRSMGMQAGIAINPGTAVESVLPLIDVAQLVLVMTVNPGWGGQKFIGSCLSKVRAIRIANPTIDIEVDGGIDPITLPSAKEAGANLFVAGSYLVSQDSILNAVGKLRRSCD